MTTKLEKDLISLIDVCRVFVEVGGDEDSEASDDSDDRMSDTTSIADNMSVASTAISATASTVQADPFDMVYDPDREPGAIRDLSREIRRQKKRKKYWPGLSSSCPRRACRMRMSP